MAKRRQASGRTEAEARARAKRLVASSQGIRLIGGKRLFCFGIGYTAVALMARLHDQNWAIAGTCQSAAKRAELRARGIDAYLFDRTHPLDPAVLRGTTHLLSSVPPEEAGDPVLESCSPAIAALRDIAWVGYLSTTGVYGDHQGAWVDETMPPTPATARGRRRLVAEQRWAALRRQDGLPVHRFRLAGIYGPGRNVLLQLRAGTARLIEKPGQVFSRIHVADIAMALEASMARPNPGQVYNLCDDEPAAPAEVIAYAALLLGLPMPPAIPLSAPEVSAMARSFYADNKRVRATLIKRELGLVWRYPTYREGLAALARAGDGAISPAMAPASGTAPSSL
jgi:nucleoside-diphosphate-sugar epimerase